MASQPPDEELVTVAAPFILSSTQHALLWSPGVFYVDAAVELALFGKTRGTAVGREAALLLNAFGGLATDQRPRAHLALPDSADTLDLRGDYGGDDTSVTARLSTRRPVDLDRPWRLVIEIPALGLRHHVTLRRP